MDAAYRRTRAEYYRTMRHIRGIFRELNAGINNTDFQALIDGATTVEELSGRLARYIVDANGQAINIINGSLDGIYGDNFEAMARQLGLDLTAPDFDVNNFLDKYTKRAYNRLESMRYVTEDVEKAIRNALAQGEGIKPIARAVQTVSGRNRSSALTTARTETFRVSNQARFDLGEAAQTTGLEITKTWQHVAADQKTFRDWHVRMNGETVPFDKPFSNGLMKPLDVDGPAAEVISCRCNMELRVVD